MSTRTLYVGNLPFSMSESALESAFSSFGATSCRIIEGRGFGFVDIDPDRVESAISEMNGTTLEGRTITVNEARPREERPVRGGGYAANRTGGFSSQRTAGFGSGRSYSFHGGRHRRGW